LKSSSSNILTTPAATSIEDMKSKPNYASLN
jgi:hypothetical protein